MKKLIFLIVLLHLAPFSVSAEAFKVKVIKITKKKTKALVQSRPKMTVSLGDFFTLQKNCQVEVIKKGKTKIVLSLKLCKNKRRLKKGSTLTLKAIDKENEFGKAQTEKKPPSHDRPSNQITKNFRLGIIKSFLDGELSANGPTSGPAAVASVDHKIGFSLGYAHIKRDNLGYMTNVLYTIFNSESSSIMINGNITWGFPHNIYAFSGLVAQKYIGDSLSEYDPRPGFRAGAGYQITERFGAEVSYLNVTNRYNISSSEPSIGDIDIDFKISGIELKLYLAF